MSAKITSVLAKQDDGNIQITYTIPLDLIQKTKSEVLLEMAKDMTVPGFRKGNAPISKVEEKVDQNKLTEHILSHILPKAFSDSVGEHKLRPAIYPKFSAVNIDADSDWQIEATTCELPEIKLGDYKNKIAGELRASKIVVPGRPASPSQGGEENNLTDEKVITALLSAVKIEIPKILVEEEVNGRLSQLLERIEKLGLTLDGYLASIKETAVSLRQKYDVLSKEAISTELILNQIAADEKIEVSDTEVDEFIKSTGSDITKVEKEQRETLKRVVQRRKALEIVAKLAP
jgi:FKBP-type peptidyl-prolyl cis-trans isomerase (trigger factor)